MANNIFDGEPGPIHSIQPEVHELLAGFRSSNIVNVGGHARRPELLSGEAVTEPLDTQEQRPNDRPMTDLTRPELDAKLETIEARMDGRVASIEAKIDGLVGVLNERFKSMDERMGRMEGDFSETKSAVSSLKSTIIVTAISTVLAIVLGVAAFNATVLSNMVASFESGKSTTAAQAEVKRQTEETAALLKQIQQQLGNTAPQAPAAPPAKQSN